MHAVAPAATIAILVPLVGRILPGLFFGFLGGLIADRWSRKTTMIVSDFGRAVLVLPVPESPPRQAANSGAQSKAQAIRPVRESKLVIVIG